MKMKFKALLHFWTVLPLAVISTTLSAASITYSDFTHYGDNGVGVDYVVTVDDDTPGKFTINFDVADTSVYTTGKFIGFFFDVGTGYSDKDDLGLTWSNPSSLKPSIFFNTKHKGNANLNGATTQDFDVLVRFANNGSNRLDLDQNGSAQFQINDNDFSLDDWGRVGMRAQDVISSTKSGLSAKDIQNSPDELAVVPIPAAIWLFGSALFGMAGIGIRRRQKV